MCRATPVFRLLYAASFGDVLDHVVIKTKTRGGLIGVKVCANGGRAAVGVGVGYEALARLLADVNLGELGVYGAFAEMELDPIARRDSDRRVREVRHAVGADAAGKLDRRRRGGGPRRAAANCRGRGTGGRRRARTGAYVSDGVARRRSLDMVAAINFAFNGQP